MAGKLIKRVNGAPVLTQEGKARTAEVLSCAARDLSGDWKIHVPNFFKELLNNRGAEALAVPCQLFADKLAAIGARAIELQDKELLKLCCDLTLFAESDPLQPEYNPDMLKSVGAKLL